MPNGRGSLDCSYCVHFDGKGYPDGHAEERRCSFHQTVLPKPKIESRNRICGHFEPNEAYQRASVQREFITVAMRFAWFGIQMVPGTLYEFSYNNPPGIYESAVLRIVVYPDLTWKKPDV